MNRCKADLAMRVHAREIGVRGHLGQLVLFLADLELNLECATAIAVAVLAMLRKTEPAMLALVKTPAVIFNAWDLDIASLQTVRALKE